MEALNQKERDSAFIQFVIFSIIIIVFSIMIVFFDQKFFEKDYSELKERVKQVESSPDVNFPIQLDSIKQKFADLSSLSVYDFEKKNSSYKSDLRDLWNINKDKKLDTDQEKTSRVIYSILDLWTLDLKASLELGGKSDKVTTLEAANEKLQSDFNKLDYEYKKHMKDYH
jgi:hypothetical protein